MRDTDIILDMDFTLWDEKFKEKAMVSNEIYLDDILIKNIQGRDLNYEEYDELLDDMKVTYKKAYVVDYTELINYYI